MSLQSRTVLALALCALIFVLFDWLGPKPDPALEEEAAKAEAAAKNDAQEPTKAEVDEPDDSEEPAPTSGAAIAAAEHEVSNELLALRVSNRSPGRGGLLASIELRSPQFAGQPTQKDALRLGNGPTLEVSFADEASDVKIPKNTTFEVRSSSASHVELAHRGSDVEVVERFEMGAAYDAKLTVTLTNRGTTAADHRLHLATRVGVVDSQYDISRGVCRTEEDLEEEDASDVEDGPIHYSGPVRWAGADNKYFGLFMVPVSPGADCEIKLGEGNYVVNRISSGVVTLQPGESQTHEYSLYIGPKELARLKAFGTEGRSNDLELQDAIDWGFLGGLSEWLGRTLLGMLRWFFSLTGSWGISIVLLTLVVKVVTLPLTLKQMHSMKRMREIQPEMAKIKQKYGDDRVKQGQEMQALFQRSGVNPLAGCLPTLVQLPIWFALYSMLSAAVELVHQTFLWLPDLTQQDPYFVLPLALGALMVVQNRLMPNTMDEAQAKMMRWLMPIMFTMFMLFLPSGLAVYIFANILLSIVQTLIQVGVVGGTTTPGKPA